MVDNPKTHSGEPLSSPGREQNDFIRRRSTRLLVTVPVTISGQNARGETFQEEARTTVVNPHGASIATSQSLVPGSEIQVENPPMRISVRARVTRFLARTSSTGLHQIDVELAEPRNIWGIKYPPADWQQALASATSGDLAPAQTQLAESTGAEPVAQTTTSSHHLPLEAAEQGTPGVLSAVPAASMPGDSETGGLDQLSAIDLGTPKLPDFAGREGSIEAWLPSNVHAAEPHLGGNAITAVPLEQRLAEAAARAEQSAIHLEELASKIEETRWQAHIQTEQAKKSVQEAVEEAFHAIRHETDTNLSRGLESLRSSFQEETRRVAADQASALSHELKQEIIGSLNGVVAERLSLATGELGAQQSRTLEETQGRLSRLLDTSLQDFQRQLQQSVDSLRESALANISREGAARVALEYDNKKAEIAEQAGAQAREVIASALEDVQRQLRQTAEDLRTSAATAIAEESAAKAAVEIQARQAELAGQAEVRIRTVAQAELETFQVQLRQSAEDSRTSAAAIAEESAAKAAVEIQARQAELAGQAEVQIRTVAQAELESFQAQLRQSAEDLRVSATAAIAEELVVKATEENRARQAEMASEMETQMRSLMVSSVEGFEAESARAASRFRESILPGLAQECAAASADQLSQVQRDSVQQTAKQIQDLLQSAVSGFGDQLRSFERTLNERAEELLRLPVQQMNQYAEDTAMLVRERVSSVRASQVEMTQIQLAAMTRGSLRSMTEEVKATMEEYRNQLREIFEGLRERSSAALESYMKEALDHSRECVMQQLQKDAEDFTTVAVAQFHSRSSGAIQEATEAIHKQVGSAAFVVKDWLNQAAQQMDARVARLEARSDSALEAMNHRSQDLSRVVLDKFQKESETVMASLRVRIQNAVKALDSAESATPSEESRPGNPDRHSQKLPVPSSDR